MSYWQLINNCIHNGLFVEIRKILSKINIFVMTAGFRHFVSFLKSKHKIRWSPA